MPWLRLGDDSDTHPIVMRLFGLGARKLTALDPWERTCLVHGFVLMCATHSAGHLTDRFVARGTAMSKGGPQWERWAKDAEKAGYWARGTVDGQDGYHLVSDPNFIHVLTRAQVDMNKLRDADRKNPNLTWPARRRDGDNCRYCGVTVFWSDRTGAWGATYDHVDPSKPTTLDTYVVCCRGCNTGRMRDPGNYILRPVPEVVYYDPTTITLLAKHGLQPRPGYTSDTATPARPHKDTAHTSDPATSRTTLPAPPPPPGRRLANDQVPKLAGLVPPGRDGTGSGRVGSGAPPTTSAKRKRGRRARRRPAGDT